MPVNGSPYAMSATSTDGHMRRLEELEGEIIRLAIGRYEGRMSEVARRLGIGRDAVVPLAPVMRFTLRGCAVPATASA